MGQQVSRSKPIDKWIPWFFVLFFLVIAGLDGVFVTLAVTTQTGVVTENAYEKGLAYNETLHDAQARDALGWNADISYKDGSVSAVLSDKDAQKISGADVVAKVIRPVQDGYDFELKLTESGSGVYSAPANFPLPGQWDIRIFATWQGSPYQSSKMVVIR